MMLRNKKEERRCFELGMISALIGVAEATDAMALNAETDEERHALEMVVTGCRRRIGLIRQNLTEGKSAILDSKGQDIFDEPQP